MAVQLPTPEECRFPSHFYRLMELKRETIPDMRLKTYIPIFIVNLVKDKVCPDSQEDPSSSSASGDNVKRPRRPRPQKRIDKDSSEENGWTQDSLLEKVADFEGTFFMKEDVKEFVENVLLYALEIRDTSGLGLELDEFVRLFCLEIEFPCLELLWLLDSKYKLMSLSMYLMRLKSKSQLEYFTKQFLAFCFSPCLLDHETSGKSTEILQDFLRSILTAGYCNPECNQQTIALKDMAIDILIRIRHQMISLSVEAAAFQNLHLLIAVFRTVPVVGSIKRRYFAAELSRILTLDPELSVEEVLQQQEKIVEQGVRKPALAETIALFIGEPQTKKEIIAILEKALEESEKLNWTTLLSIITVWEEREFGSRIMILLKSSVKSLLISGLTEEKKTTLISAFIIARHCCLISPQRFARYEEWYTGMFEKELETVAGEVKLFNFLIKTLTELVCIEPACFLQVHATYPPFIPVGCDDIWAEYLALAKSRITEYHEVEEAMIYEPNLENPIQHEVEMAIKSFDKFKKIPDVVSKMYMFNRHYYLESFLPELIKKPLTTALSDGRLRLIETLHAAGKLPQKLYAEYKAQRNSL